MLHSVYTFIDRGPPLVSLSMHDDNLLSAAPEQVPDITSSHPNDRAYHRSTETGTEMIG